MEKRLIISVFVWNCDRFEVFYGHNNMIVISIVVVFNTLHLLLHIYLIPNLKPCSNTKTIIFIFSCISKTIYSKSKILPSNLAITHSLHIEYNFNNSICTSISFFFTQIKLKQFILNPKFCHLPSNPTNPQHLQNIVDAILTIPKASQYHYL